MPRLFAWLSFLHSSQAVRDAFTNFFTCTLGGRCNSSPPPPPKWSIQPQMHDAMQVVASAYDGEANAITRNDPRLPALTTAYNSSTQQMHLLLNELYGWDGDLDIPSNDQGLAFMTNLSASLAAEVGFTWQEYQDRISKFTDEVIDKYNPTLMASFPTFLNQSLLYQNMSDTASINQWINSNILVNRIDWFLKKIAALSSNLTAEEFTDLANFYSTMNTVSRYQENLQIVDDGIRIGESNRSVSAMAANTTVMLDLGDPLSKYIPRSQEYLVSASIPMIDNLVSLGEAQNNISITGLASQISADNRTYTLKLQNRTAQGLLMFYNSQAKVIDSINGVMAAYNGQLASVLANQDLASAHLNVGVNDTAALINATIRQVQNVTDSADTWSTSSKIKVQSIIDSITSSRNSLIRQISSGYQSANQSMIGGLMNLVSANNNIKQVLKTQADSLRRSMTLIVSNLAESLGMSMSDFANLAGNIQNVVSTIQSKFDMDIKQNMTAVNAGISSSSVTLRAKLQEAASTLAGIALDQEQITANASYITASAGMSMLQSYTQQLASNRASMQGYGQAVIQAVLSNASQAYTNFTSDANTNASSIASSLQSATNNQERLQSLIDQASKLGSTASVAVGDAASSTAQTLDDRITQFMGQYPAILAAQLGVVEDDVSNKLGGYLNSTLLDLHSQEAQQVAESTRLNNQIRSYNGSINRAAADLSAATDEFDAATKASETSIVSSLRNAATTFDAQASSGKSSLSNAQVSQTNAYATTVRQLKNGMLQKISSRGSRDVSQQLDRLTSALNDASSKASEAYGSEQLDEQVISNSLSAGSGLLSKLTNAVVPLLQLGLIQVPVRAQKQFQATLDELQALNKTATDNSTSALTLYTNGTQRILPDFQQRLQSLATATFTTQFALDRLLEKIKGDQASSDATPSAAQNMTDELVQAMTDLVEDMSDAQVKLRANITASLESAKGSVLSNLSISDMGDLVGNMEQLSQQASANESYIKTVLSTVGGSAALLLQSTSDTANQAVQQVNNQLATTSGNTQLAAQLEGAASQANINLLSSSVVSAAAGIRDSQTALKNAKFAARNNATAIVQSITDSQASQARIVADAFKAVSDSQANLTSAKIIDESPLIGATAQQTMSLWTEYSNDALQKTNAFVKDQEVALTVTDSLIRQRVDLTNIKVLVGIDSLSNKLEKLSSFLSEIGSISNAVSTNNQTLLGDSGILHEDADRLQEQVIAALDEQVLAAKASADSDAAAANDYINHLVSDLTSKMQSVPVSLGLVTNP